MDDQFQQLYEYLEELETELWQRGMLNLTTPGRPHSLGIRPHDVFMERDVSTGGVYLHFADGHGCKLSAFITGRQAFELGLQDPEGYWYRRYREVVLNGATQKDRDRLYKENTGSRENSFWNTLERAMGGDDQLQRITQITREQDR